MNIFVRADLDDRIKIVSKRLDMTENKAKTEQTAPVQKDDGLIFPTGVYKGVPYFRPPVGFDEKSALVRKTAGNALAQIGRASWRERV